MQKTFLSTILIVSFLFFSFSPAFSQEKTLNFGTVNWPPYFGENLENGGIMTEITTEAFKRTGWDYNLKFMNWNRAMGLAKKGKLDGVQGAYYNKERDRNFMFTDEIISANIVIFQKKGAGISYNSLEDLKDYTFGILRGWAYPEEFVKADYLEKEETDTPKTNILKLLKDRVDLIVADKLVTLDVANEHYPDQADRIEALEPPLEEKPLHVIVTEKLPNHAEIVNDFNKGLKMLKEDGTFDKIMEKHGF